MNGRHSVYTVIITSNKASYIYCHFIFPQMRCFGMLGIYKRDQLTAKVLAKVKFTFNVNQISVENKAQSK